MCTRTNSFLNGTLQALKFYCIKRTNTRTSASTYIWTATRLLRTILLCKRTQMRDSNNKLEIERRPNYVGRLYWIIGLQCLYFVRFSESSPTLSFGQSSRIFPQTFTEFRCYYNNDDCGHAEIPGEQK